MGWAQAVSHFNLVLEDTCHFNFLFFYVPVVINLKWNLK